MKSPRIRLVKGERSPLDHADRMQALRETTPAEAPAPLTAPATATPAPTLASLAAEVALLRQAVEGLVAMQRLGFGANASSSCPATDEPEILYGAAAIAGFLGLAERQVRHLTERGAIPFFRIQSTLCARPSSLREWIASQEAAR